MDDGHRSGVIVEAFASASSASIASSDMHDRRGLHHAADAIAATNICSP